MTLAGMKPDSWQAELLRSLPLRTLALCSRQSGKSTWAASCCVRVALTEPDALVLVLSPTLRQSIELYRKALVIYRALGRPVASVIENRTSLELVNGSRIVALPGDPDGIVGYSAPRLVVVDEAARAPDELYLAIRPMLAVSRGRLVCCTTPLGRRGFFFKEWSENPADWHRVMVTAEQCPRITPEFLEAEKRSLGERWYRQDYLCSFEDSTDAVFSYDDIMKAMTSKVEPIDLLAV